MASVQVQDRLNASIDQVWQLVADFGGIGKWIDPSLVKSCEADGNNVGAMRTIVLADGGVVKERLDALEPGARRFTYAIVGESPIPVDNYSATVKLTEADGGTQIDWVSTFEPRGISQAEAEEIVNGIYTGGIAGIRKAVGG